MNAVLKQHPHISLAEQLARACGLRQYDRPVEFPKGGKLRFFWSLALTDDGYEVDQITDVVFVPLSGEPIQFDLRAFSKDELGDIRDEIEAEIER